MNTFFKTFLACLAALVAVWIISFIVFAGIIGSAASMFSSEVDTSYDKGTYLYVTLNESISDSPNADPMAQFDFATMSVKKSLTLIKALSGIEAAALDENIEGIYMDLSAAQPLDMATFTTIRKAMERFKTSGKPIVCYADYYSHSTYFLASLADKIYLAPAGSLQWQGLASQVMFFKGTLDKLGVKPEIIRHGKFKSAIEPYTETKMSEANRLQTQKLVGSIWGYIVEEVSKSRDVTPELLQQYATDLTVTNGKKAEELKFIDGLEYNQNVEKMLADKMGEKTLKKISLYRYVSGTNKAMEKKYSANKVAIIYAEGNIVSASSGSGVEIVSGAINEQLHKAAADSTVKAVVLRINSPGGSALAADNIWSEVKNLRDKKPVIVSMGSVAASGGYYIAAPADIILAEPTTITGSIGVFGLMFNAKDGLRDKLGITVDGVNTNPSADMGSIARPLTTAERAFIQSGVEDVYSTFIEKVAEGRNLSLKRVDQLGQGRVWSGIDALEVGLIDGYGSLPEAIAIAAERAGVVDSFRIYTYSNEPTTFEALFSAMSMEAKIWMGLDSRPTQIEGRISNEYENIKRYMGRDKIMTSMPYTIYID